MKNQSSDTAPVQEPDETPGVDDIDKTSFSRGGAARWSPGGVFWGILFIVIGILILLDNLGVLSIYLERIWFLWPVAIIGIGISLLSVRSTLLRILSLIFVLAVCSVVAYILVSPQAVSIDSSGVPQKISVSSTSKDLRSAEVVVDAGAARINLSSDKNVLLVDASLESDWLSLQHTSTRRDGVQLVNISTDTKRTFWIGSYRNDLDVTLGRTLPTSLTIKAGASQLKGDLSDVRISRLVLKMGASDINLRVGDRLARQDIEIDAGASNVVLYMPADAGVRVRSESGLTHVNLEGVNKISDSIYESDDFANSSNQIIVEAKLGVSNFTIRRY